MKFICNITGLLCNLSRSRVIVWPLGFSGTASQRFQMVKKRERVGYSVSGLLACIALKSCQLRGPISKSRSNQLVHCASLPVSHSRVHHIRDSNVVIIEMRCYTSANYENKRINRDICRSM